MGPSWLVDLTFWLGVVIVVVGLLKLLYVPLALIFEVRDRRSRHRARRAFPPVAPGLETADGGPVLVSVVIPGYNEEAVLENCVHSVMATTHPRLEVILVDDGSTDATFALMQRLAQHYPQVRAVTQPNAGKGAALNHGARLSSGEVLLFVDSDGIFSPDTIPELLAGFTGADVGAVCGDDRPANPDRALTKLLTVISHVGTGLVRRALHLVHALPIVSGNIGAFRRSALQESGLLRHDTVGEDLELTWRLRRVGYRAAFAPRALVYAESPSTVRGLWKQRVRWARGLLQTTRIHWQMIGNPRYGFFGIYLAYNTIAMIITPVLQILALVLLIVVGAGAALGGPPSAEVRELFGLVWQLLAWVGLPVAVCLAVYSMWLNRALSDLRYGWTFLLWPLYSFFLNFTMMWALWLEARKEPAQWNKLDRTGVVAVEAHSPTPPAQAPAAQVSPTQASPSS